MVYDMMPAKLAESKYYADFLNFLNPSFKLPSRRKYMTDLKKDWDSLLQSLKSILAEVPYVATTGTTKE